MEGHEVLESLSTKPCGPAARNSVDGANMYMEYCILCVIRAQLKSSFIADVVIPVKKSKKKWKQAV